jgi:hypothetical protein
MRLLTLLAIVSIVALDAGPAAAEPTKPTVDLVLEILHVEDYLGDVIPAFEAAVARRKKENPISETQKTMLLSLGRRIYPPKNLMKVFKPAYAKAMTPEALTALYAFLNTPTGIKLRQGYAAAYRVKSKARQAYFDSESGSVLKPNRRNALTTYITEWQQDLLHGMMAASLDFGVAMGLNPYQPATAREKPKDMKDKYAQRRASYQGEGRNAFMVLDFYILQEAKNEEIDEMSKFASTNPAKVHTQAMIKGMEAALNGGAVTMQEQVVKALK